MGSENDELSLKLARQVVYGETLLAIFPFLVTLFLIISGYKDLSSLLFTSDWSLAGSLLAGQAIIRYSSAMSRASGKTHWQIVSFQQTRLYVIAALCLIIFGVYNSQEEPSLALAIIQLLLFLSSLYVFLKYSTASQWYLDAPE